jgi:hypothetical protein
MRDFALSVIPNRNLDGLETTLSTLDNRGVLPRLGELDLVLDVLPTPLTISPVKC